MPAVAVRHERRKGQEKRSKRPSQLYIGGHWLPPTSPSPTPSPKGQNLDSDDRLPEYYLCGKVRTTLLLNTISELLFYIITTALIISKVRCTTY